MTQEDTPTGMPIHFTPIYTYSQFIWAKLLTGMFWGDGQKLENLEESHRTGGGREIRLAEIKFDLALLSLCPEYKIKANEVQLSLIRGVNNNSAERSGAEREGKEVRLL